ncbi:XRE family transcriptional regulator [Micromonospora rosaria]|uniref:XRE family transcriptional regulator n=1 Tax=Micromonospora rosaria TaxID=47874 RepID=A0A136PMJ2_9ACTN|nr:XRE family transcriptional regulator [Micromonospora rosaria]
MVVDAPAVTTPDDDDRIAYVVDHPSRLDARTVELLADALAAQRRLDDAVAARLMLPAAVPQCRAVQEVAAQARGPHAPALHEVAAEWTQFLGWLYAEDGRHGKAVRALTEAADQADAVASGVLAAQAENFLGYVQRHRRNPRGIVRHFLAAYHTPGSTVLQRIGDGVQAAHGYALLGDRAAAVRLLAEASDLVEQAESASAPPSAYWLTPTFGRMNIGLAHLALGEETTAADHLRAGLDNLPEDQRDAEWTTEYRQALVAAGG